MVTNKNSTNVRELNWYEMFTNKNNSIGLVTIRTHS